MIHNLASRDVVVHIPPEERERVEREWYKTQVEAIRDVAKHDKARASEMRKHITTFDESIEKFRANTTHEGGIEHVWLQDIRTLSTDEILDTLRLNPGDISVITGGPPCQGFSKGGGRNVMDERNSLVMEFTRMVRELKPTLFMFENVRNLLNMTTVEGIPVYNAVGLTVNEDGLAIYESLRRRLAEEGSDVVTVFSNHKNPAKRESRRGTDDDDVELGEDDERDVEDVELPDRLTALDARGCTPR